MKNSDRRNRALAMLEKLELGSSSRVSSNLDSFHPEATEILLGFAFNDVVARDDIPLKTREMLTIAMLAAIGTAPGQLEFHVRAALNNGVSREEIIEIVLQVAVYAGIPAAMNAITSVKAAFATNSDHQI
ncbi:MULTISPECIES: carboxymuconolactone decarboxylase family protein [unclassified Marinobacter]|jgi:4-carboxymuconolactone decarboxylase|uniref:carboxymuconolactone decarboxylase family protein n=1 Tax=unclassified Marinobacter TaxID=83889 RepID=UPI0019293119|nr:MULTISPECIES: carboxymuconolactone decarboxylase family protein [unclassified Marinobacter]MBL3827185.1 carboxymuconolactone decarboxylase family protein [Marinobacter sp. MC3]MBL3895725.1 carboxymuconolactone decarboxylase family protein [Marinobacter sp. MW3]